MYFDSKKVAMIYQDIQTREIILFSFMTRGDNEALKQVYWGIILS